MKHTSIDKHTFFQKYSIDEQKFDTTDLDWSILVKIYEDYIDFCSRIDGTEMAYIRPISKFSKVHSVRWRIKNPEHLVEKIIRKALNGKKFQLNIENYRDLIKDILGIRALHLYKKDFKIIHNQILKTYNKRLAETPIIYYREGDDTNLYSELSCDLRIHNRGYRSVHYVIQDNNNDYFAELQVRTIFEEGWSEIDHDITYPYEIDNPTLNSYLATFNRVAGAADEMGAYVKSIKQELCDYRSQLLTNQKLIENQKKSSRN